MKDENLKIIDMKNFREELIKTEHPDCYKGGRWNPDFVGSKMKNGKKGFFHYTYGKGESIRGALKPIVDMAEDSQAIYEFIQNAVDCGATEFYMFYDETNFLVLNNGESFSINDVKGVLNAGQGTKINDVNKIGEYGIGFKLIHKLIGEADGIDEMMFQNKGPIIFSWDKKDDFQSLTNSKSSLEYLENNNNKSWLFKILLTCFPIGLGEEIIDLQENKIIAFDNIEFMNMIRCINQNIGSLNINNFHTGSLFYLEFGKGKSKIISEGSENQMKFLEASISRMKKLKKVVINSKVLENKKEINWLTFNIDDNSFLQRSEKKVLPEISFGYENWKNVQKLKLYPTFYKYFACSQEMNNSSIICDSNAFAISPDRTRIDHNERNSLILENGVDRLLKYMEIIKESRSVEFFNIFSGFISSSKSPRPWQNECYIDLLHDYASKNVPTKNGGCVDNNSVAYKNTKLPIDNLTDLGIDFDWYYWDIENEDGRKEFSVGKNSVLKLVSYNIKRILEECDAKLFNKWVCKLSDEEYLLLLEEIGSTFLEKSLNFSDIQVKSLKLFRENRSNYSLEDISSKPNLLNSIFSDNNQFHRYITRTLNSRSVFEKIILKGLNGNNIWKILPSIKLEKVKLLDEVNEINLSEQTSKENIINLINFACSLSDSDTINFRSKLILHDYQNKLSCNLKEASMRNILSFSSNERYKLTVKDILPNANYTAYISLKENIVKHFKSFSISNDDIDNLFKYSNTSTILNLKKQIYNDINNNIEGVVLQNPYQVAFIFLYSRFDDSNINIGDYKYIALNDDPIDFDTINYLNSFEYIDENWILNSKYNKLIELLKLNISTPYFKSGNYIISISPVFESGKVKFSGIKDELIEEQKIKAFNDFYRISKRINLSDYSISELYVESLSNNLGVLNDKIIDCDYRNECESVPTFINKCKTDTKFLRDLGVLTNDTNEINFRKSLVNSQEFNGDTSEFPCDFTENTLEWIKEKEIKCDNVIQVELLNSLLNEYEIELDNCISNESERNSIDSEWEVLECIIGYDFKIIEDNVLVDYFYEDFLVYSAEMKVYIHEDSDVYVSHVLKNNKDELIRHLKSAEVEINNEELVNIYRGNSGSIDLLQEEIIRLKNENKVLKSSVSSNEVKSPFRSELSKEDQIKINNEAKRIVKEKLSFTFNFSESNIDRAIGSVIKGVIDKKTGETVPLVVKSLKTCPILNLNPGEVLHLLSSPNSKLIVHKGNGELENLSFDDVINSDTLFHVQFRIDQFNPLTLGKFAEVLQYKTDVKFQFDNPNHTYVSFNSQDTFLRNHDLESMKIDTDMQSIYKRLSA